LERQLRGCSPLFELIEFVDQENTFALGLRRRLHNPHNVRVATELFHEYSVITWQNIGVRYDVHVNVVALFIFFSYGIVLLLHVLPISLDVLAHQILSGQLVMIGEMIKKPMQVLTYIILLIFSEAMPGFRVEYLLDGPYIRPEYVPIIYIIDETGRYLPPSP